MWKDMALGLIALLLLVGANLNLCCKVSVDGHELEGCYSPAEVEQGIEAAEAAAEEILLYNGRTAEAERRYILSLRSPAGHERQVADALLRSTDGVAAVSGVYVDGTRLGVVGDEEELRERLDNFIYMQQPTMAVRSLLNGNLSIRSFYSRSGNDVSCDDMVLLITGKAHVMYMDENGKFV